MSTYVMAVVAIVIALAALVVVAALWLRPVQVEPCKTCARLSRLDTATVDTLLDLAAERKIQRHLRGAGAVRKLSSERVIKAVTKEREDAIRRHTRGNPLIWRVLRVVEALDVETQRKETYIGFRISNVDAEDFASKRSWISTGDVVIRHDHWVEAEAGRRSLSQEDLRVIGGMKSQPWDPPSLWVARRPASPIDIRSGF